jgi:acetylornithine deacetylase/succinyl-diaminopimelate desuccinylase-like protein
MGNHMLLSLNLLCLSLCSGAQPMDGQQIEKAANEFLPQAVSSLRAFIAIPNDGRDTAQIANTLNWCVDAMISRGFDVSVIRSNNVPYVFAERTYDKRFPVVLFYIQADGQPVNSTNWDQPNPYVAVLKRPSDQSWEHEPWTPPFHKESRIFGRSASDSKGPAIALFTALDVLASQKRKPAFNIKLIMDFQEEMGSPTLPSLVNQHKSLLASKMVLIMDGTRHVSNLPTLNFGARGIATITLKVFGPQSELHSGQYGNYAPNPVFKLARILAGMKDENGRVLIPGFYHGVSLPDAEKEQINNMPASDGDLNYRLGIAANEKVGHTYEESLQYPSLNIRGIRAADVGTAARTVIPADAIAEIDLRLVPETPAERQVGLLKNYIEAMGFHFVDGFPTPEERSQFDDLISFEYRIGSKPFRTDLNGAAGLWLTAAMDRTFGRGNYVKQRTTGGSQPIEPFITALGIPAVSLRIPNPDNNIHAANENLRIGNLQEGIQMCLGVLTQPLK